MQTLGSFYTKQVISSNGHCRNANEKAHYARRAAENNINHMISVPLSAFQVKLVVF